ncbi:MAG: hypothetical protein OXQ90_04995, partial [Gammaproteobacteria bacterium]|nr:hypothetical protein [Gammaproteobacteria bacterium]
MASGYRLTEDRAIQIEAELRSPPFDHRASVDWGTGTVDEAGRRMTPGALFEAAACGPGRRPWE